MKKGDEVIYVELLCWLLVCKKELLSESDLECP